MNPNRKKVIAIIGDKRIEEGGVKDQIAFAMGKALVDHGYRVQTGGYGGVMSAAMRGARASENYKEGDTIAILPCFDVDWASEYADIVIPTGIDMLRNAIVANADAVIGVGGGAGTLCEYAFAWSLKRLIIAFENSMGWSEKLAGTRIVEESRYPDDVPEDHIFSVTTPEQAIELLEKYIDLYDDRHTGIKI